MLKCLCRCQALYADSQIHNASYGIHFIFLLAFTWSIWHDTWSRHLFYIMCNNNFRGEYKWSQRTGGLKQDIMCSVTTPVSPSALWIMAHGRCKGPHLPISIAWPSQYSWGVLQFVLNFTQRIILGHARLRAGGLKSRVDLAVEPGLNTTRFNDHLSYATICPSIWLYITH